MNQAEIIAKLQTVFDEIFVDPVTVTPELTAEDVEEWDSLLHISLEVAIEKAFGIKFRVGETRATKNVGELATVIQRRLAER
jgi:acyl carrier protein